MITEGEKMLQRQIKHIRKQHDLSIQKKDEELSAVKSDFSKFVSLVAEKDPFKLFEGMPL